MKTSETSTRPRFIDGFFDSFSSGLGHARRHASSAPPVDLRRDMCGVSAGSSLNPLGGHCLFARDCTRSSPQAARSRHASKGDLKASHLNQHLHHANPFSAGGNFDQFVPYANHAESFGQFAQYPNLAGGNFGQVAHANPAGGFDGFAAHSNFAGGNFGQIAYANLAGYRGAHRGASCGQFDSGPRVRGFEGQRYHGPGFAYRGVRYPQEEQWV